MKKKNKSSPSGVHLLFCAHLIYIFLFILGLLDSDILSIRHAKGCLVCVIVFIPSYSIFVRYDCSQIEYVHPIFCTHLIHVLY